MVFISYGCSNDDTKTSDNDSLSRKTTEPYGLITPERAKELNGNWNSTRVKAIESALGKQDNQSVKFSLQDMRDYLDNAENEVKDLGYEMDGVRIYFAAYGENEDNGKAGQATVILVPTGRKSLSEANMFFKWRQEGGGDIPDGRELNMGTLGYPSSAKYPK